MRRPGLQWSTTAPASANRVPHGVRAASAMLLFVGLVASLTTLVMSCPVEAAENDRADVPIVVLIGDSTAEDTVLVLAAALEAQFADLDVQLSIHWLDREEALVTDSVELAAQIAAEEGAAVVLQCNPLVIDALGLYIPLGEEGTQVTRAVTAEGLGEAGRLAATAVIARALVEAVLERSVAAPVSATNLEDVPAAGPSDDAALPVPTAGRKGPGISAGVGYGMRFFSSQQSVVHAVTARVELAFSPHVSITVGYALGPGIRVVDMGATLRLTAHDVVLGVAVDRSWGQFSLGGELAAVVGLQSWESAANVGGLQVAPGELDVTVGGVAELRLGLQLTPWVRLVAGPGLRVLAINQDYDVVEGGWRTVILAPRRFQPHLSMRFQFVLR